MRAKDLIEFIQNPMNPSINPWSFQQRPGAGAMGTPGMTNQPPAKKTTGDLKVKRLYPSNVDVRFIKQNTEEE